MARKNGSTLILPIDALAGSHVKDVASDMVAFAVQLDCGVSLNMNGVHLIAFPHTKVADIKRDYEMGLAIA